jgi:hypothetical protein
MSVRIILTLINPNAEIGRQYKLKIY